MLSAVGMCSCCEAPGTDGRLPRVDLSLFSDQLVCFKAQANFFFK